MSFFWYDYETWGKSPYRDRIVQFGGIRTNEDLELIGEPIQRLCKPGLDCRIGPGAVNVHNIMPMEAHKKGFTEADFTSIIYDELIQGGTCSVAYNGMSFDHEFTRMLFYRNLRDPYRWEWDQGNSTWDIIELMRAAYLLYPVALPHWPEKVDGRPSFQLSDLSSANVEGVATNHHDAITDVMHMWELAKLIYSRARHLWNYAYELRLIGTVQSIMDGGEPVLYVVGGKYIGTERGCATFLSKLDIVGTDASRIYGFDLFYDPTPLLKPYSRWTPEDKSYAYRAIQFIKRNKSPFVCKISQVEHLLSSERSFTDMINRMQSKESTIRKHHEILTNDENSSLVEYIKDRDTKYPFRNDPDEAIYDGFISDQDRNIMNQVLQEGADFDWHNVQSDDLRVEPLIFRFLARNYPQILNEEAARRRWEAYCRFRQIEQSESRRVTADQIFSYELCDSMEPWGTLMESQVKDLLHWQNRVRERLEKVR